METNYLVHPDVENRLTDGFWSKIQSYQWDLPYQWGFFSNSDVASDVEYMKGQGFYKALASQYPELITHYRSVANDIFQGREARIWSIRKPNGTLERAATADDLIIFMGIITAEILMDPENFWNVGKNHGFYNPIDFVGSLGVLLKNRKDETGSMRFENPEQTYFSERADGSKIRTIITGDIHGDFRIIQTDITAYETISPFGNESSFRPVTQEDNSYLSPYHSTEPAFFSAILKYAEQVGKQEELGKDMDKLLTKFSKQNQRIGNFSDFWDQGDYWKHLIDHAHEIPRRDDIKKYRGYTIFKQHEWQYQAFIDTDSSLIFSYINKEGVISDNVSSRFYPDELSDLVRTFFAHAKNGTGRTSLRNLTDMLEYYRSDKFWTDMKRIHEKYK